MTARHTRARVDFIDVDGSATRPSSRVRESEPKYEAYESKTSADDSNDSNDSNDSRRAPLR